MRQLQTSSMARVETTIKSKMREFFEAELGHNIRETSSARPKRQLITCDLEEIQLPTISDVRAAIVRLKRIKSPRSDGVPVQLIRRAGHSLSNHYYYFLRLITDTNLMLITSEHICTHT